MPVGMEIYSPTGQLLFDLSLSTGQVCGYVTVNTNGTVTDARFSGRETFTHVSRNGSGFPPTVSISGNVLTYTYPSGPRASVTIVYGVL